MKLIPYLEISSRIMTLLSDAESRAVIVSPYVNIENWSKMKRVLLQTVERGVKLDFYKRSKTTCDISFLKSVRINLIEVDNLHAKIYLNEKYGIITSQNLYHYSDNESIDIAYITESENERNELENFILKNIKPLHKRNLITFYTVKSFNYDEDINLSAKQIELLMRDFSNKFPKVDFNSNSLSDYVYSNNLFPFADVMVHNRFEIRIPKNRRDIPEIVEEIESIPFHLNCDFRYEILEFGRSFYCIHFIPAKKSSFLNIKDDYFTIAENILENKNLKIKHKTTFW